jgi:hypothetical protein
MNDFIEALAAAQNGGMTEAGSRNAVGRGNDELMDRSSPGAADDVFRNAARDLFLRLTRRSDNRGMSDEHRAANYIALRCPQVYQLAADAWRDQKILVEVQLRRGPMGTRRTIAVRLIFRARRTDVIERYSCLVDVTDRFPFLAAPLSPIYD